MDSLAGKGAVVFDLSGAFRLQNSDLYTQHYQFEHNSHWLDKAVYGLAEHFSDPISIAELVAVPGCYPTASLTALLPVKAFIDEQHLPIINAVSGVSGAGRKAAINTSFTEVSLQAYGVHSHRHQPEISSYLQREVIFTPHLGNFKRGILATITVRVKEGVTQADIDGVFAQAYTHSTIVRIVNTWPKVDDVAGLPYCDLYWQLDEHNGYLIIASALDNLLKGAATQAIQCANLRFGLATDAGLLGRAS
jgi:N-acetyl-gamma-glutamyl-phosphate reductase